MLINISSTNIFVTMFLPIRNCIRKYMLLAAMIINWLHNFE